MPLVFPAGVQPELCGQGSVHDTVHKGRCPAVCLGQVPGVHRVGCTFQHSYAQALPKWVQVARLWTLC